MTNLLAVTLALCSYESGNAPHVVNYSDPTPAWGYCQIRQIAATDVKYKGPMRQLLNKSLNIRVAHKYLAKQYKRCKSVIGALTAYNSGRCGSGQDNAYSKRVSAQYYKMFKRKLK